MVLGPDPAEVRPLVIECGDQRIACAGLGPSLSQSCGFDRHVEPGAVGSHKSQAGSSYKEPRNSIDDRVEFVAAQRVVPEQALGVRPIECAVDQRAFADWATQQRQKPFLHRPPI